VDGFGDGGVAGFEPKLLFRFAGRETGPRREAFLFGCGCRRLFKPCRNSGNVAERFGRLIGGLGNRLESGRSEEFLPKFAEQRGG